MRLRPWMATLVLAAVLAVFGTSRASAQTGGVLRGSAVSAVFTGPANSNNYYGTGGYVTVAPARTYSSGYSGVVSPYSYYAAIPPTQPRTYVGYGNDIFPFYGRPYGSPNDRWSWNTLAAGNPLARYYYAPVR
ncbi:MAG: hypothetical protein U0794_22850 [Isosphaeraceae bacterium]